MAKRKLTKQQQARIQANQKKRVVEVQGHQGLLAAHYGKFADIIDEKNVLHRCSIRQNLPELVVGDSVIWQEEQKGQGIVKALIPRDSELYRIGFQGKKKLMAANLNQVIVVLSVQPTFSLFTLDCYLAAAEVCQLTPVIVINKIDLLEREQLEQLQSEIKFYSSLGYHVLYISSTKQTGVTKLQHVLANKISVFTGPSGAGKSTLINWFVPDVTLMTQTVSQVSQLGQHTTTTSQLYKLPEQVTLIDSPGIRGFSLGCLTRQELYQAFVEIKPYQGQCKFRDCQHESEPECALRSAVEQGKVKESRFFSFKKLLKECVNG